MIVTANGATSEVHPIIEQVTAAGHIARFAVRDDTNDSALVRGIIGGREYPFERLQGLTGDALDIGAHIGIVTVAIALDNPTLRIVAVEALAENVEMLRRNVRLNNIGARVRIVEAAVGADEPTEVIYGYEHVPEETEAANLPGGYVEQSRFIGNIYSQREGMIARTRTVTGMSLGTILDWHEISRACLAKIDIEGGEWTVLLDRAVSRVDRWVGELHGEPGMAGLRRLLPKYLVTQLDDNPINPIFEAVRR